MFDIRCNLEVGAEGEAFALFIMKRSYYLNYRSQFYRSFTHLRINSHKYNKINRLSYKHHEHNYANIADFVRDTNLNV